MAKKAAAKGRADLPVSQDARPVLRRITAEGGQRIPTKLKSSSLLDTRVIYCGDNLEQPEQMRFPILYSEFTSPRQPLRQGHAQLRFYALSTEKRRIA
jgi:hypothetical protein